MRALHLSVATTVLVLTGCAATTGTSSVSSSPVSTNIAADQKQAELNPADQMLTCDELQVEMANLEVEIVENKKAAGLTGNDVAVAAAGAAARYELARAGAGNVPGLSQAMNMFGNANKKRMEAKKKASLEAAQDGELRLAALKSHSEEKECFLEEDTTSTE